ERLPVVAGRVAAGGQGEPGASLVRRPGLAGPAAAAAGGQAEPGAGRGRLPGGAGEAAAARGVQGPQGGGALGAVVRVVLADDRLHRVAVEQRLVAGDVADLAAGVVVVPAQRPG